MSWIQIRRSRVSSALLTFALRTESRGKGHGQPASFYILYIQLFNLELVLGGLAVVLVWLTVMLSPTIQRSATWVNMLVSCA
jgi:hypothetical protein